MATAPGEAAAWLEKVYRAAQEKKLTVTLGKKSDAKDSSTASDGQQDGSQQGSPFQNGQNGGFFGRN